MLPVLALLFVASALLTRRYVLFLAFVGRKRNTTGYSFSPSPRTRFLILVPAHNEEQSIGRTVTSIKANDYPKDLFQTVVIADNCTDGTDAQAKAAGAEVWVRNDVLNKGKGQALAWAINKGNDLVYDA